MARALPTTKAQVSGHKFLVRRLEHGLVFGDIRMIHDPLKRRRRALLGGVAAVVFLCVGSGLIAWMQPDPQPGDAPVVRSAEGQLLALVNGTYHPVANLASARLIANEPVDPSAAGAGFIDQVSLGTPLGIADAPNLLAASSGRVPGWAACLEETTEGENWQSSTRVGTVTVVAHRAVPGFDETHGAVAESDGTQWLLTGQGRVVLPEASSTQGRVVRRALGMTAETAVWAVPPELLNAFAELEPLSFPAAAPQILDTGESLWVRTEHGVTPVTPTQAEMLVGVGAQRLPAQAQEVAALGDAPPAFNLPTTRLDFLSPEQGWLCANSQNGAGMTAPVTATIDLPGDSAAARFAGLRAGVGADSGHGFHVVAATGRRHVVANPASLHALGLGEPEQVPWEILRLLPEGSPLSREDALAAQH
ncbi:type VII secretion protein EccB [Corynebacterium sp. LaCa116]|uniref:type VII secretion protein EccB n=1 Tax=Corynebacterium sp. LaCa116 TaxID=3391423 RepID=UPI003989ED33